MAISISAIILLVFLLAVVCLVTYFLTARRYKVLLWAGGILLGFAGLFVLYILFIVLVGFG
jgi:hypothetical protein